MPPKPLRRPICVDFFCGAGGMSVGLEQAGFDVALGVDYDGYHAATHERNFPYGKSLCRSVANLTGTEVHQLVGRDEVDLVCGGPPCQGFSTMGRRDFADPRNSLVGDFVRLVTEIRPKAFLMENVPGMLSGRTRPVLDAAVAAWEAAGYRVTHPIRVLDASHYGAPQRRKRVIVLGIRRDCGSRIDYPSGPAIGQPLRPTVLEAIADLPDVDRFDDLFDSNAIRYSAKPKSPYAKFQRDLERDPHDFSYPRLWSKSTCTGCQRVRHSEAAIALYRNTPPGEMVPSHKLPRLDPDGLAPTLRAGSDSSHGSYTAPRPIHPVRPRCITAREAARLHGFPDWFAFYPNKWQSYRQIGNAVCPPLARALGESILKSLGIVPVVPSLSIALGDEFVLPPDRPRSLKRLPEVVHVPPVVADLFDKRFDSRKGTIRQSGFSFADVLEAVSRTGVTLNGLRAETFVGTLARSRNVDRLLEPCLKHGFTIRPCRTDDRIGEFVPAGHPDGIWPKVERPPIRVTKGSTNRAQKTLW
jgi:DNA (cytosine-5)-methyltransferase 1